ncbi:MULTISPECIES: DUF2491 family protein [Halomonas]|uniref:DUF2491 domain-containing protein n=1 Tax=Halomonas halophila TaxID=29573 RepID=A0ABQ0U0Q1_9GAMM|nr:MULTISPECIES: DUF2491 family protein [Halomonas]MDR5888620.1 DUF2491 family protein [Halomonas salina]WJY07801.1 DUF2491 family protein [Halomonas halophila]GEK72018.1 hypothetical protein HHA04nite_05620 [Halomonas halophila]
MFDKMKALLRGATSDQKEQQAFDDQQARLARGLPTHMSPEDFAGMRLDGRVTFDLLALEPYSDLLFDSSMGGQDLHIAAVGRVDLGQGESLVRFYLENDTWVQASVEAGKVIEYKLFDFYQVQHLADTEFDRLINEHGVSNGGVSLGKAVLPLESESGQTASYGRVWGQEGVPWSPPVLLEEEVTTLESVINRRVIHHCMLYERQLEGEGRYEYVLLSGEADEEDRSYQLVTNLGIDLNPNNITAV